MWATAFNRLHALLFLIAVQPSLCNAVYLGCPAYSQKDYPRGRLHYFVPNNCSEEFVSCVNDRPPATFKCDSGMVFDLSNNTCVLQKDCESSGDPQPTTSTWTNASSNASSCDGDFVWDLRLKLCFDEDCGADAHQPKTRMRADEKWKENGFGDVKKSEMTALELEQVKKRCVKQPVARAQIANRIMGGSEVENNKATVFIYLDLVDTIAYGDEGFHVCTGFFFSPRHILTVRHCFETDQTIKSMTLRVGGSCRATLGDLLHLAHKSMQKVDVESLFYFSFSDGGSEKDYALITLTKAQEVEYACLGNVEVVPETVIAEGFGYLDKKNQKVDLHLQQVSLSTKVDTLLADMTECQYPFFCGISRNSKPAGVRLGDSGGPAYTTEGGIPTVYGINLRYNDVTETEQKNPQTPFSMFLNVKSIQKTLCEKFKICIYN